MYRPQNRKELWSWIRSYLGVLLPHRAFTPGHSTPMDFLTDAYFNPGRDVAAWASRSGIKTLSASILAAMELFFHDGRPPLQARVLAGSEAQASVLYEYWRRWCETLLAGKVTAGPSRRSTDLTVGRIEILPASHKRVRGPKVQRLFEDELDEIDADVDAAAAGMIASKPSLPARTVYTSTWHRVDGPMAALVNRAESAGIELHKWNLWESLAQCPIERHEEGRHCEACPLGADCLARARAFHDDPDRRTGIAAECDGLYAVEDAIKACRKLSAANWQAEYLCRRPSAEGLVYPEFDPAVHACESPPAELTIYRSIDWGLGVFVCLWLGADADGRTYVLDTYRAERGTVDHHAEYIGRHRFQQVAATYCDPAGVNRNDQTGISNVQVFARHGIVCRYTTSPRLREVRNGVSLVRAALAPAVGAPRLRYVPSANNRAFVRAMSGYRNRKVNGVWTDHPADPQAHEHIPDALRYYFINRQPAQGVKVVGYGAV